MSQLKQLLSYRILARHLGSFGKDTKIASLGSLFLQHFDGFQVELVNDSLYEWNVKIRRVDPDSPLAEDLKKLKEREGKDYILMSFMFKVS